MVLVGYDAEHLFFMDPSVLTPGAYAFMPRAELDERWHDLAGLDDRRLQRMVVFVRGEGPRWAPGEGRRRRRDRPSVKVRCTRVAAMSGLLSTVQAQPTAVETLRRALAGRARPPRVSLRRARRRRQGADGVRAGAGARLRAARRGKRRRVRRVQRMHARRAAGGRGAARCTRTSSSSSEGLYDPAAIGRKTPETQELSIDQVRTLVLARAAFPPHEGRAKVFIVRRAEELSIAAANALLKTLEEPGARTHFVLLSSTADSLLPTIRSRTQRVRFGPLPDAVVAELLVGARRRAGAAGEIARLAGGSMATAATSGRSRGERAARGQFVSRAMAALERATSGERYELAADAKKGDKAALVAQIEALAAALAAAGALDGGRRRPARRRRRRPPRARARGGAAARRQRLRAAHGGGDAPAECVGVARIPASAGRRSRFATEDHEP